MFTTTIPTTVRSPGPFEMGASVDASSAMTGATAEEEEEVEDAGTTAAPIRSGATGLARTTGRTSLMRVPGGISLARTVLRAMLGFLRCHHHQEGMTTTTKTRGLGASRSHALSLASWAVPWPQPLSASSSSLLAR